MKRLICIALLLALAVCAVAEEDLTLDLSAAGEIAPVEGLLLPEEISLEFSDLEPDAESLSTEPAMAANGVDNRGSFTMNYGDITGNKTGVANYGGSFTMNSGIIRGNKKGIYTSPANDVAVVNGSGKVTAMAPGKCTIWVLASNGVRASVKATVK